IERGEFNAGTFINNMKKMVDELVYEVRSSTKTKRLSSENETPKVVVKKTTSKKKTVVGKECPKCKNGQLLKGSTAYGCSAYKNGCDFKLPFEFMAKKISENQLIRLLDKGCTTNLKGFKVGENKIEGLVRFDESFNLKFEPKKNVIANEMKQSQNDQITSSNTPRNDNNKLICPKCKKGTVLKGKSAYGCSEYKNGCNFVFTFDNIKKIANGQPLTKELVYKILNSK
ncbi:MAG: DNA topoisomerase III, partial [Tenacibaculum sp.]